MGLGDFLILGSTPVDIEGMRAANKREREKIRREGRMQASTTVFGPSTRRDGIYNILLLLSCCFREGLLQIEE